MNLQLLTEEDWKEFKEDNPFAYGWLEGRSLLREYELLKTRMERGTCSQWSIDRYHELKQIFGGEETDDTKR